MPIKHKKDTTHLAATLKLRSSNKPYFIRVFLWGSREAMRQNTGEEDEDIKGMFCPAEYFTTSNTMEISAPRCFGELHFVKDDWDQETVAHELVHALIHRIRVFHPDMECVVEQYKLSEEVVAYEYSRWFEKVYNWLWEVNPSKRWKRVGGRERKKEVSA